MTRRPIIPLVPPRPDLDSSSASVPDVDVSSPSPTTEMARAYVQALRAKPAPKDEPGDEA